MEGPGDWAAIRAVNERAFGRTEEANVVEKIRANCPDILSLVALREGRVVGHVLFSPATIDTDNGPIMGMGLAPMAVPPECQRQGIGSALVRRGLELLGERSCPFVIVLGHPEYYPRFGFERASRYGLKSQWEGVPDEAFMVLFLNESAKKGVSGTARYREEFDEAM
jgi:putative acetyltransferase